MIKIKIIFFFNDTATTEIYTLSLHDALPISDGRILAAITGTLTSTADDDKLELWDTVSEKHLRTFQGVVDRKSTRLNSSHANISYAVFCLKKKNLRISHITIYTLSILTQRYL